MVYVVNSDLFERFKFPTSSTSREFISKPSGLMTQTTSIVDAKSQIIKVCNISFLATLEVTFYPVGKYF
jgi:hypothetical protein